VHVPFKGIPRGAYRTMTASLVQVIYGRTIANADGPGEGGKLRRIMVARSVGAEGAAACSPRPFADRCHRGRRAGLPSDRYCGSALITRPPIPRPIVATLTADSCAFLSVRRETALGPRSLQPPADHAGRA